MPAMNSTGPQGAGQMTGRGLGMCNKSGAEVPFGGKGRGMGRGRKNLGKGFGHGRYYSDAQTEPGNQKDMLKLQKECLENQLESVNKQIEEL